MKPITFKEQNVVYAENQPEYLPLPAHVSPMDPQGPVISCWNLSFKERLRVLFTGRIWLLLLSFGKPLTPSRISTSKKDIFS